VGEEIYGMTQNKMVQARTGRHHEDRKKMARN